MDHVHHLLFLAGALGLVAVCVGQLSARLGAPLLLVFLGIGMLAGEGGPGGLRFADFHTAYLVGSLALAVILFEGGLKMRWPAMRRALGPALLLATLGVAVTAALVGVAGAWLVGAPFAVALLVGAAVAPTDAAAVATLLGRAGAAIPERVTATLEAESGLNDPMSVFLTILVTRWLLAPEAVTVGGSALLFVEEMGGGALAGVAGGLALRFALSGLEAESGLSPVLALMGALTLFGAAQSVGASGFLAVYIAGLVVGTDEERGRSAVEPFFEGLGWLAQIGLFLMLGLLVTPGALAPVLVPSLVVAGVLIFVARPLACLVCLSPFDFTPRETAFAAWVGLRGAVPVYLMILPILSGMEGGGILFGATFVIVVASLVVQGWTIAPAARLLGFVRSPHGSPRPERLTDRAAPGL